MDWKRFRATTEKKWADCNVCPNVWGYQIQPGTEWNPGLSKESIASFEDSLGFTLPNLYKEMLLEMNGFDRGCIDLHGSDGRPESYSRQCYKYLDDLPDVQWLLEEIGENQEYVYDALGELDLGSEEISGYVPLFSHRALVVTQDIELSPVISVVGDDVILYGKTISEYWGSEFDI
jgi:SMI1 / KNR4 family (SUKH-1)